MADNKDKQQSKKSESIEVRLPFETKAALAARSKRDGQSMSDVVRLLIEQYLANTHALAPQFSNTKRLFIITRKRAAAVLSALAVSTAIALATMAPSQADDVELSIGGHITQGHGKTEITKQNGTVGIISDGISVIKLNDKVITEYGKPVVISHTVNGTTAYILEFTSRPTDEGNVYISVTIKHREGGDEKIIATPSITVEYQKNARIEIAGDNDSASLLSLNVLVKKL